MKISKKTIIIMILVCVTTFCISLLFEFVNFDIEIKQNLHFDFYKNISLGIFASSLLVLIPSIVHFNIEKKNYYIEMFKYSNVILFCSLEIITYMEQYCQDKDITILFDNFNLKYNELISRFSTFTYFFWFSKKDKLIESIICETTKFIKIQEELLKYSKKFKNKSITENEYKKCFDIIREEMINTYREEFVKYQQQIEKNIKCLVDDRKLNTYVK